MVWPIISALQQRGGVAAVQEVRDAVHEQLQEHLMPADLEKSYRPDRPVWWSRCADARTGLVKLGLMSDASPKGLWELTEAGMNYQPADEQDGSTADSVDNQPTVDEVNVGSEQPPCQLAPEAVAVLEGQSGRHRVQRARVNSTTSSMDFEQPIVSALLDLGGRAAAAQVRRSVLERMEDRMLPGDYDHYPSGPQRWTVNLYLAQQHLVMQGIIDAPKPRGAAPHGLWQFTDWAVGRSTVRPQSVDAPSDQDCPAPPPAPDWLTATMPTGSPAAPTERVRVSDEVLTALRSSTPPKIDTADGALRHLLNMPYDANTLALSGQRPPSQTGVTTNELKHLITDCLTACGGSADNRQVVQTLRSWLTDRLTEHDLEQVQPRLLRWEMRVAAAAQLLRQEGVIVKPVARGVWQLNNTATQQAPSASLQPAQPAADLVPLPNHVMALLEVLQEWGGVLPVSEVHAEAYQRLQGSLDPRDLHNLSRDKRHWQQVMGDKRNVLVRRGLMFRSAPNGLAPHGVWMLTEAGMNYPTSARQTTPSTAAPDTTADNTVTPQSHPTTTVFEAAQPNPDTWHWLRVTEDVLRQIQANETIPGESADWVLRRFLNLPAGDPREHPPGAFVIPANERLPRR